MSLRLRTFAAVMLAFLFIALPARSDDVENAYDVLGKTLLPVAAVFGTGGTNHALVLDAHLLEASKLPPELQGQAVHISLATPDAVLIQAPIADDLFTICRDGNTLWAMPGSKIQAVIDLATSAGSPSLKKKKKTEAEEILALGPLALPVPEKDLVFLPILFQVADAGSDTVSGKACRVLDVQLMDQIAKKLHAEHWSARLWIGANYSPVQIALKGPDWSGTVAIDKLTLSPDLPEAAFQPQGADVIHLAPAQFLDLLSRVGRK
jgi:hypothetical protein